MTRRARNSGTNGSRTAWSPTACAGHALVAFVVLGGVLLPACSADPREGYSLASTYPDTIRTVAVPVFDNQTYSTGLEVQLTEALIKEIQRSTRWTVVGQGSADAVLTGTLTSSALRRLASDSRTGLVQEQGVDLRVDFEFKDTRSGKPLTARRNFAAVETFAPSRRVGERLETGQAAAVAALARDLVAELRSAW